MPLGTSSEQISSLLRDKSLEEMPKNHNLLEDWERRSPSSLLESKSDSSETSSQPASGRASVFSEMDSTSRSLTFRGRRATRWDKWEVAISSWTSDAEPGRDRRREAVVPGCGHAMKKDSAGRRAHMRRRHCALCSLPCSCSHGCRICMPDCSQGRKVQLSADV